MCKRRDRKEKWVTKDHKDTNTVENYNNLDIVTAIVFYWKNPMNNTLTWNPLLCINCNTGAKVSPLKSKAQKKITIFYKVNRWSLSSPFTCKVWNYHSEVLIYFNALKFYWNVIFHPHNFVIPISYCRTAYTKINMTASFHKQYDEQPKIEWKRQPCYQPPAVLLMVEQRLANNQTHILLFNQIICLCNVTF